MEFKFEVKSWLTIPAKFFGNLENFEILKISEHFVVSAARALRDFGWSPG